ncbi:MAG: hypothetical protein IPM76_09365 [Chloroflexi bacterium]|nr:hypothetical protein [Chloroflexota bacterium]
MMINKSKFQAAIIGGFVWLFVIGLATAVAAPNEVVAQSTPSGQWLAGGLTGRFVLGSVVLVVVLLVLGSVILRRHSRHE